MKLPAPRDQLAGCFWLPRILAKARLSLQGELPPDYAARFCHPGGVDGQFLSFFALDREQLLAAALLSNEEAGAWFCRLPAANEGRIAAWNEIAVNLGRPGYPMAERFPIAMATTYTHLAGRGFDDVFSVLEADEA